MIETRTVPPGFSRSPGFGDLHPDLDRGGVGVDRGTDHRHFAGDIAVGSGDARRPAHANGRGFFHRNIRDAPRICEMSTMEISGVPVAAISPG